MANCKSGDSKRMLVIGWIGGVSHHFRMLLGAIELIILCAFVCKV